MRRVATFRRWTAILTGLACSLALLGSTDQAARAETISISITLGNGDVIPVDALILGGATPTFYGNVDIATLNSFLSADGSAYQFSALGGSSNYSGASSGGTLTLTGGISIPAGMTGNTGLTITETESGFITPSGPSGTLASSSTGNFNDAGTGNYHTAFSSFNALPPTPTYTVASTKPGPDFEGGGSSTTITSFSTPYTLTNSISFNLVPSSSTPTDGFSVTVKATAVPEPASLVTMAIGLPLPLLGLAWLRRRRNRSLNT